MSHSTALLELDGCGHREPYEAEEMRSCGGTRAEGSSGREVESAAESATCDAPGF
jgi:hypothetical protein